MVQAIYSIIIALNMVNSNNGTQVIQRRKIHGDNEFSVKEETPLWQRYMEQVGPSL